MRKDKVNNDYVNENDVYKTNLLKKWQDQTWKLEHPPTNVQIRVFVATNSEYTLENEKMLIKWTKVRHQQEFLTVEQINEWYEFYFK